MNKTIYKIAFVGDIMQHEPQLKLEGKRNFIYKNIVSENIEKLLKSCDSVVGNFETIVDINKNPSGFPNFNVHENFVHELKRIGLQI